MRKSSNLLCWLAAFAAGLLPAVASAQADGRIAQITYWKIHDGHQAEFEAGLQAHNEVHRRNGDPSAHLTWRVATGKRVGQYIRGTFGLRWEDLDHRPEWGAADDEDAALNVDPHLAAEEPLIGRFLPEVSNPGPGGPFALNRVIYFHVRPGRQRLFLGTVAKIHQALQKVEGGWPSYFWYEIADGGQIPTYVVSLGRKGWAGFDEASNDVFGAITAAYGPEGASEIADAIAESVEHQHSLTAVFRPDLSYLPATE